MKNKDSLSKVERQLLPRLKFMGYVMYTLCLSSLVFAIFFPEEEKIAELGGLNLIEEEFNPKEVLNFYLIAAVFAAVGCTCMLIVRKKRKILFQQEINNE